MFLTASRCSVRSLRRVCSLNSSTVDGSSHQVDSAVSDFVSAHNCEGAVLRPFIDSFVLRLNILTAEEEESILAEILPYMKRLRYETAHWDDAISGYRETERTTWRPENESILKRVRDSFLREEQPLSHVHILDLASDGVIRPHVDSTRFCGSSIAGLSLLSDAIMRFRPAATDIIEQGPGTNQNATTLLHALTALCSSLGESSRSTIVTPKSTTDTSRAETIDVLLPRRSLYLMRGESRLRWTHEILSPADSVFRRVPVERSRRISVIQRTQPDVT